MRIRALLAYISTCVTPRAERLGAGPHLDDRRDHRLKSRGEGESGGGGPRSTRAGPHRGVLVLLGRRAARRCLGEGRGCRVPDLPPSPSAPLPPPRETRGGLNDRARRRNLK